MLGAMQAFLLSLMLYFSSPWLLKIWTHNAIKFDANLMALMLVYAAVGGLWHIPRAMLMATNQHVSLSCFVLLTGLLSVVLSSVLGHAFDQTGVVTAMIISELLIATICIYLAWQPFRECKTSFLKKINIWQTK